MRRKIPSSAALLAFEAAARHGNFARAAAELALTEGAISRQIARLEALLDSKLFDRTGSRVRLNPAGARYAAIVPRDDLHHRVTSAAVFIYQPITARLRHPAEQA